MSLRTQPLSERVFATFVLLALAAVLAGGFAFITRQARAGSARNPAARPRLLAVLEGVMAQNTSATETAIVRTWIQNGATQEAFAPVEAIVENNCASCHGPGGQFPRITNYEELHALAREEDVGGLFSAIGARDLHLVVFPLVFLVAAFGYLRRATWRGRFALMGGCAMAVLFDAAQWWLRQGHAGALGFSWAAMGLLAIAYLAVAVVVMKELWTAPTSP